MVSECAMCSGIVIDGDHYYGSGFHTMKSMLGSMFGIGRENVKEDVEDGIQLIDGNLLVFDNSSREYTPLGVRINYCPMCGNKLESKNEEA